MKESHHFSSGTFAAFFGPASKSVTSPRGDMASLAFCGKISHGTIGHFIHELLI
jgi:hypothetical protein